MITNYQTDIKIRSIQPIDYNEVKSLLEADTKYHMQLDENFKHMVSVNQEYFDNELENSIQLDKSKGDNLVCVLNENGESTVVGILSYRYEKNNIIYIADLYIKSQYRGRGFAKMLLNYLIKKNPDKTFELMCLVKNTKAYKFYLNYGFKVKEKTIGKKYKIEDYIMIYKSQKEL